MVWYYAHRCIAQYAIIGNIKTRVYCMVTAEAITAALKRSGRFVSAEYKLDGDPAPPCL